MALYKLSKSKTFHVDYCGCTAAAFLLNDQAIRDGIDLIRQIKTKRDFVKTTVTTAKDGIKIIYNNEQKFSTIVPSTMIAGSAIGKASLCNTIGVVYISPLTGHHYPAFVHVYRCDTSHSAQKFLSRLRSYLLIESHRLRMVQLEEQLLERSLLNIDRFNEKKSQKNNIGTPSSSATNSNSRQENKSDPIKSITEELKQKIDSNQPILFPPKDYDTIHAAHGNIKRAQAWKSTEPAIVGYSPIDPDDNRPRRHLPTNSFPIPAEHKINDIIENNNETPRLSTHRSDATVDPVETVSLAFDFLKDETGSIFNDNDGNVENLVNQQQNKPPVYRFRPPQISAITKKLFSRNNNYEVTNGVPQSNSSSRNDLDTHYNDNNNNNHHHHHHHHRIQNGHRTRSETHLHYDQQPNIHLSPRYESRLVTGSGIPITTNPLWADPSPNMAGSQPNLLSHQNFVDSTPLHHQLSPQMKRRMPSIPLEHTLYASYPDTKSNMMIKQQENQHKRSVPTQYQSNKKQTTQSHYLDTTEFILRPSNGQPLRNAQYPNGHVSRDYRPHSMNVSGTLLDVYY